MAGSKRGSPAGGGGAGNTARADRKFATADCGSGNGCAAGREPGRDRRGGDCPSDGGREGAQGRGQVPRGSGAFACGTRGIGCTGRVERAGAVRPNLIELLPEGCELLL